MSTVSVTNLKNAASASNNIVLAADGSVSIVGGAVSPYTGMRNRIINGAMTIDQRNAGAATTPAANGPVYLLDRFFFYNSQVSKLTYQQNAGAVTPPVGFSKYFGITVASAATVGAGDVFLISQAIEGQNVADLDWGTANAATVSVSFWVRSSLTGNFSGALQNSGNTRTYAFSYAIAQANTWEKKTITVAGDTAGTWLTNNGTGISLVLSLGAGATFSTTAGSWVAGNTPNATGSVNLVATSGATFYITGVQLEKGSVATPFEFRSIGTELGLCQRYAIGFPFGSVSAQPTIAVGGSGLYFDANIVSCSMNGSNLFNMRTVPTTITSIGTQGTDWGFQTSAGVTQTGFTLSTNHGLVAGHKTSHGLGANNVSLRVLTSAGNIIISSEL